MLISVVVPVFNVEQYLKQCIDSILKQTFTDYEIILVDDGSSDNCPQICNEYVEKYKNVKVIHKENGGLVSARKFGVNAACGEYICFVDSDDWIKKDFLSIIASKIEETHSDVISMGFTEYKNGNEFKITLPLREGHYEKLDLINYIYPNMLSMGNFYTFGIHPSVCLKCIRRPLISEQQKCISDVISLGEDAALTYACLLECTTMDIISNTSYVYRYNDNSMTHSYNEKLLQSTLTLFNYMDSLIKRKCWNCGSQFDDYIINLTSSLVINEFGWSPNSFNKSKKVFEQYKVSMVVNQVLKNFDRTKYPIKNRVIIKCLNNNYYLLLKIITKIYIVFK